MTPLLFIRRSVFGVTQAEMAGIAGVSQGTISKWEAGTLEPSRIEMKRIREEAGLRAKPWSDEWFYHVSVIASSPSEQTGAAA